jgi:hypothetical protein
LGHTGQSLRGGGTFEQRFAQQWRQQAAGDGEADPLGLSRAGEGGEGVLLQEYSVVEQGLEFAEVALESVALLAEGLQLGWVVEFLKAVQETLAIAVKGLAGEPLLAGALADRAVGPVENGGSIGDTLFGG